MREIFFANETWRLTGDGDFNGTFHLFKGGHDLHGTFASIVAGVNDYRFPALYGSLQWTPDAFEVWNAGAKFYGGDAQFTYSIKPLGKPSGHDQSSTPPTPTSISRSSPTSSSFAGCASPVVRRVTTCSSGRSAVSRNIAATATWWSRRRRAPR